jgi:hypothetical protein
MIGSCRQYTVDAAVMAVQVISAVLEEENRVNHLK